MNKTGKGGFSDNPDNINKNGRPTGTKSTPDILRKIGMEERKTDNGKIVGEKLDVIMRKVFNEALDGKSWAVQFIADRTEGKAVDRIEATINKEPIRILEID